MRSSMSAATTAPKPMAGSFRAAGVRGAVVEGAGVTPTIAAARVSVAGVCQWRAALRYLLRVGGAPIRCLLKVGGAASRGAAACGVDCLDFILRGWPARRRELNVAIAGRRGIMPGFASSPSRAAKEPREAEVLQYGSPMPLAKPLKTRTATPGTHFSLPPVPTNYAFMAPSAELPSASGGRLYVDTGCSFHLAPRAGLQGAILQEWDSTTEYTMVRKHCSFDTQQVAAVGLECKDELGNALRVVLRVNIGPDDVPFLLKPLWAHLVPPPECSWVVVVDYYGEERKILVEEPTGSGASNLPSTTWRASGPSDIAAFSFLARGSVDAGSAAAWHERLFHPCAERLAGTLSEQGLAVTPGALNRLLGPCTTCALKNATKKKLRRRRPRPSHPGEEENGGTLGWDLAHMAERGYKGECEMSLLLHEESMLWHAVGLKKKSDAPQHLLQWIDEKGPPSSLRSDCAGELKGTQVQLICSQNGIYMKPSPPHCSAHYGRVERAIREFRSFLAIIIHSLQLPFSIWPALVFGVCELHNKLFSPTLQSSPWLKYYGFPPRLSPLIGDCVVLKLPGSKGPKKPELPGKELMYLGMVNSALSLVLDRSSMTVVRVHPSQLLSFRARTGALTSSGGHSAPSSSSTLQEGSAPESRLAPQLISAPSGSPPHPRRPSSAVIDNAPSRPSHAPSGACRPRQQAPPPILFRRGSTSSSSSSSSEEPRASAAPVPPLALPLVPAAEDLSEQPADTGHEVVAANGGGAAPRGSAPRGDGLGGPPAAPSTRRWRGNPAGSPPASPRLAKQSGVIATQWGQTRTAALVTARARGSYTVNWLRELGGNQWMELGVGSVSERDVLHHFVFTDSGSLPPDALAALAESPSPRCSGTLYCVTARVPSGSEVALTLSGSHAWLPDTHRLAALAETVEVLRRGVIGDPAPPSCKSKSMRLGWRFTEKPGPTEGAAPVYKARLYCMGFMDRTPYETYAGTISFASLLIFLIFVLTRNWLMWVVDAKNAYLQVPLPPDVTATIVIPPHLPHLGPTCPFPEIPTAEWDELRRFRATLIPGQLRYLCRSLYGDRRSPFLFHRYLRERLDGAGFDEIAESLFTKSKPGVCSPVVAMAGHVDDFALAGGEDVLPKEAEVIGSLIDFKPPHKVRVEEPFQFLGMTVTRHSDCITLSQDKYISSLDFESTRYCKVDAGHLAPPQEEEIDKALEKEYRALNGQLGWAVKTRPKQLVFFSILSQYCAKPCKRLLNAMKRVLTAMKQNPCPLVLRAINGEPCLECYCDASFKFSEMSSRLGYIIYLRGSDDTTSDSDSNPIAWATKRERRLLDSSTSAELLALKLLVKTTWEFLPVIQSFWRKRARVRVLIDSRPLYDQLRMGRCKAEPSLNKQLGYVLQELKQLNSSVQWIPREKQKADVLTKPIWFYP
eukprot:GHVU01233374.1.p1 GENE.GHVU01233374.1~~GHVU01233374.1.p1  ORF type:complete len:1414 (+),score=120.93 GHVU01233374.1:692-4933(+)